MQFRPVRSVLYMPASNAKAIEKARGLDCDAIILDLEDAVAPAEKDAARTSAVNAAKDARFGDRPVVVRVNALQTHWGQADIEALVAVSPDAILVPKIATAADVHHYDRLLSAMQPRTQLWAMIETARSIFHLEEIADAASTTRLTTLVMGTNDLCKETNARLAPGRASLLPQLCIAVNAAKMTGLTILDGVYNDLQNEAGFEAECQQGLELGFDGKTLIHPSQIASANAAYSPTPAEIDFATSVIDAFAKPESHSLGALRVEGRMVERLHLDQCQRLVHIAGVIAKKNAGEARA